MPFDPGHEGLPFVHDVPVMEKSVGIRTRCLGLAGQAHVSFPWRPTSFAMVAGDASCHYVLPGVRAVSGSWLDMVNGEVLALNTAILTGESVSVEDCAPRKLALHEGFFDHVMQADDRRDGVRLPDCVNVSLSVREQFSFPDTDEYHRPLDVADVERLVVLVQHQHRSIENHHLRLVDLLPQNVHRRLKVGGNEPESVSRQCTRYLHENRHYRGFDHCRLEVSLNVFDLGLKLAAATL